MVFLHMAQRNNPGKHRHHTPYGLPTHGTKQPRKSQASHSVPSPVLSPTETHQHLWSYNLTALYESVRYKHYYYHYPLKQKNITYCNVTGDIPSVLWRCWLGGRKGIRPVKNWVVGCWHGYLSGARCRLAYDPADATATHCLLLQ